MTKRIASAGALALALFLAFAPIWPALAGDSAATTWADVNTALAGLAVVAIGALSTVVVSLRGVLSGAINAWAAAQVEKATGLRVQRLDAALSTAIAAGNDPEAAARAVAEKLPQTLARSNKSAADLVAEAGDILRARGRAE